MSKLLSLGCSLLGLSSWGCLSDGGQSGTDGLDVIGSPSATSDAGSGTGSTAPPDSHAATTEPVTGNGDAGNPGPSPQPSVAQPAGDAGNTLANEPSSWLGFCGRECGDGLSCICGVCTRQCDAASECSDLHPDAQCAGPQPAERSACSRSLSNQVCELSCGTDADCAAISAEHVCDGGQCRAPAAGWLTSLCEAPAAMAVPECAIDERLSPVGSCTELSCVLQSVCDQPPGPSVLDCPEPRRVQYNVHLGRCEYAELCPRDGSFQTMQECWQTCQQQAGSQCLEDYRRISADSEVIGADATELQAALTRTWTAPVRYLDGSSAELNIELTDVVVFDVLRTPNPNWVLDDSPSCTNAVIAEARARLFSSDGQFDETWQRLPLDVASVTAVSARVQVIVPTSEGNPADGPRLGGLYSPEDDPEHCLLGSAIELEISEDDFSGELRHERSTRPCGDPLGVTNSSENESPNGPVW